MSLLARKGGPFPHGRGLSSRKLTGVKYARNRTKQGCEPDRSGEAAVASASDHRAKSRLFHLANDLQTLGTLIRRSSR